MAHWEAIRGISTKKMFLTSDHHETQETVNAINIIFSHFFFQLTKKFS